MGKLKGIIPIDGSVGTLSFYKSKRGYLVKEKTGFDAKRFAGDPMFARIRENASEFARAGKACKNLRAAFKSLIKTATDMDMTGRLVKEMRKVVVADQTSARGLRNVLDGELEMLQGFEFNANGKLGESFFAPYTATIDRVAGTLKADIPSFIPKEKVNAPNGTTHFKIVSGGAAIDFEKEKHEEALQISDGIAWDETATAAISLVNAVSANSTHPLFLVLGIQFYQQVNGVLYLLNRGESNALKLVTVSGV